MKRLKLLFGVHNHQPLGNFQHVFEYAYQKSYKPFIETINEYPEFGITYHFSGPLLLFLQEHHPEIIGLVRTQVERGQAEVIVSGFYEPVLAMIPEPDRINQIKLAKDFVKREFLFESVGLWLTERVFDSEILYELLETGIKYFLLDDAAFTQVGIHGDKLHGYYLHPVGNDFIGVFPIDEALRYLIPFRPVDEVLGYLKHVQEIGGKAAIFFDDGEKFGLWPGTYEWVYEKGWLKNFIEACLNSDFIETQIFSDYLNENDPEGVVFLPSSSYFEMGEWSLFPDAAYRYTTIYHRLKGTDFWSELKPFFRGGIWKNFLNKYRESGRMYRRMLWLSNEMNGITRDIALIDPLLRSQCNDPYWHGVFGGIYLPHLRHETYKNLITGTKTLLDSKGKEYINVHGFDFNMDGKPDYAYFSRLWSFIVDPLCGTLCELSYTPIKYNFQNTLSRYREHYHRFWETQSEQKKESISGVPSIHELTKQIPVEIKREMHFDTYTRESFIDRILQDDIGLDDLKSGEFTDLLSGFKDYSSRRVSEGLLLDLNTTNLEPQITIEKLFKAEGNLFLVNYRINGNMEKGLAFVTELNLIMPSATAGEIVISGNRWKFSESIDYIPDPDEVLEFRDNSGITLLLRAGPVSRIVVFPFYTVSQSEAGVELIYQGHSIFLFYSMSSQILDFDIRINIKEDANARTQV